MLPELVLFPACCCVIMFLLFFLIDIHGALRVLSGMDRAGIGHDAHLFEQNILTIDSLHFFQKPYRYTSRPIAVKLGNKDR